MSAVEDIDRQIASPPKPLKFQNGVVELAVFLGLRPATPSRAAARTIQSR